MYSLLQDFRVGIRNLVGKPGFTIVAVATLALGIGANTAIFSVFNGLMYRELPVPQASQLVSLIARSSSISFPVQLSFPDFRDYRELKDIFQSSLAFVPNFVQLTVDDVPERVMANYTTAGFFTTLKLNPSAGSLYREGQSELEGENDVVLDYACWQSRFGGRPDIVGKKISLNGFPVTVSGVAPKEFKGLSGIIRTDVYVPLRVAQYIEPQVEDSMDERDGFSWRVVSRLQPGVDLEKARQAVSVRSASLSREYPETNGKVKAQVYPEPLTRIEPAAADYMPMVARIFMGLVSLVLLVACANVASLLLVRASSRRKEVAVRTALGAANWRIMRQLLVESLLISVLGGFCGLLLAKLVTTFLESIRIAADIPLLFDFSIDYAVLSFAALVTVGTGVLSGLLPAWKSIRSDLFESLREAGRGTEGSSRQSLRSVLVTFQVAVSLILLICTGLFLRSMINIGSMDPGFAFQNRAMLAIDTSFLKYDESHAKSFFQDLLRAVRSQPGVISAATASSVPLGFSGQGQHFYVEGQGAGQTREEERRTINYNVVSRDYFKTLGFRVLEGRPFSDADQEESRRVAVVNQHLAETLWPKESALGKRFSLDKPGEPHYEVVGVVNTAFYFVPGEAPQSFFYLPYSQHTRKSQYLLVETAGNPEGILPVLRQRVRALDPEMPVFDIRTLKAHVQGGKAVVLFRLPAILVGMFALIGAVLAASGLYGLISYSINQRKHEIGVRLALGASTSSIIRLVSRQGILLVGLGIFLGLGGAVLVSRLFARILIGVSAVDPLTYVSVSLLLLSVAAISCLVPARSRAGKVDPVDALRTQ